MGKVLFDKHAETSLTVFDHERFCEVLIKMLGAFLCLIMREGYLHQPQSCYNLVR